MAGLRCMSPNPNNPNLPRELTRWFAPLITSPLLPNFHAIQLLVTCCVMWWEESRACIHTRSEG